MTVINLEILKSQLQDIEQINNDDWMNYPNF